MSAKSNMDNDNLKNFLTDVLKQSGTIAKKYFFGNKKAELKEDKTPVTKADKEIESFIRQEIQKHFPEYGIIGEEFEDHKPEAKVKFVIDPIDGTKAFIEGIATFGIMIAVTENNSPVISGILQPITEELWTGDNKITELNGTQISSSGQDDIKKCTIATTGVEYLNDKGKEHFETISSNCGRRVVGGDCYNYCKLAEGKYDIVLEQGLKYHDYIPLIPILRGSGAVISDFSGNEIIDMTKDSADELLVCSNSSVQKTAINLIQN